MRILFGGLAVLTFAAVTGCNMMGPENEAVTAKCKGVGSSDECSSCCSKNGINRSSWKNIGGDSKCTCHDKSK